MINFYLLLVVGKLIVAAFLLPFERNLHLIFWGSKYTVNKSGGTGTHHLQTHSALSSSHSSMRRAASPASAFFLAWVVEMATGCKADKSQRRLVFLEYNLKDKYAK